MVSITHHVERMIRQKPFLQEALSRGIVNNAALAEELIPGIEKSIAQWKYPVEITGMRNDVIFLSVLPV